MIKEEDFYTINYSFIFEDKNKNFSYKINLYKKTGIVYQPKRDKYPVWADLDYHKCSFCQIDSGKEKYCPIAKNISDLIEYFSSFDSVEKCKIIVEVEERTSIKECQIQDGLRSIIGIFMASSGCPSMNLLKPMARFHLPFASIEETVFRHLSNYLIYKYYQYIEGKTKIFDISDLKEQYKLIDRVNRSIHNRISNYCEKDASKNALFILNTLGMMVNLEVSSNFKSLKELYSDIIDINKQNMI